MPGCLRRIFVFLSYIYYLLFALVFIFILVFTIHYLLFTVLSMQDYRHR